LIVVLAEVGGQQISNGGFVVHDEDVLFHAEGFERKRGRKASCR
jgi:hypothetical protein